MNIPKPTEHEMKLGNKVEYFERLLGQDYHKKLNLDLYDFVDWIHYNYDSFYLQNKELTYKEYKKKTK